MNFNSLFPTLFLTLLCSLSVLKLASVAEAQCVPKPSGLVAWWKAENNAIDSVGGANGTLFNGASYTAGKVGQSFTLDGVDDRINVPDVAALRFTGSFSIETWVAPSKYPIPGGHGFILFRGDNRNEHDPYVLDILDDGRLTFYIESETSLAVVTATTVIPLNVFSHVAATMNGTTGEMRIYINGTLSASTTTDVRPLRDLDPSAHPGIGIGNHASFPNTPYNYPFPGRIDELSLYNRTLSSNEIQGLYDAGNGGKCDALPNLVVNNPTPTQEGNASAPGSATFNVTLSFPITQTVTVNYATADGVTNDLTNGAVAGSDYLATSGTLTFAPGETSKTVPVNFIGDVIVESDETLFLNLSNAVGAGISKPQGTATIVNDDAGTLPALNINDVTIQEGHAGFKNAVFTVTLSQASTQTVSVEFITDANTATTPADFTSISVTLTFTPGQISKTITVPIRGDTLDENHETFRVLLSNPANAVLNDGQGQGTITDDDAPPALSIHDVSVFEGNSGTINATFTITLSTASGKPVSINAITANGTARAPGDYQSSGVTLTFAPGEKSKTFTVAVQGDLLNETDELFYVLLSSVVNAGVARGRGVATIFDNDATPSISIEGVSIGEGNSGQRTASFRLKLSAASGRVVTVSYATSDGSATPGNDYVAVAPSQISFGVGSLYTYARVLINGDLLNEPNEDFAVNLSQPINASLANNQASGVILNDDRAPSLSINDVQISEGNAGSKTATFTVSLSAPSGQTITVNYASADGIARSTSDYGATNGTLTFASGEVSKSFSVTINGDVIVEGDETFYVLLSGALNATIGRARSVGVISNDDSSG